MRKIIAYCRFNVKKAELSFHEASLNTGAALPFSVQKNVYGASVIIFEGIMSFADKELLQVRKQVPFFSFFCCCLL